MTGKDSGQLEELRKSRIGCPPTPCAGAHNPAGPHFAGKDPVMISTE
jgi:hypothetical protein